ncbi:MAG TPA: protein-L-isoaspartate(D-aspartate) O-methyltransferase [Sphingomicrobium sp.]|nr:protein-L-isoaspartate(D-aspartate) O-methyltransferase [Sphingomicrobium sp.]
MKPMTEHHLALFRRHMVEIIDMHYDLAEEEIGKLSPDPQLRRALMDVPRHLFVPESMMLMSYQDTPLPIGFDKTVSQPFIGALMIDLLGIEPGNRVLEIGTGLGYQAAVMSEMGAELFSVEVVEEFAQAAKSRFAVLGYNVEVRIGDGSRGWEEHQPFDRILVTAASAQPPPALVEQLEPGGRMVIPLGSEDVQQLSIVEKDASGAAATRTVMPVRFTRLEAGA